jgi:hypothetical protein
MRFIRGDSLKEAIEGFHADGSSKKDFQPPDSRAAEVAPPLHGRLQRP